MRHKFHNIMSLNFRTHENFITPEKSSCSHFSFVKRLLTCVMITKIKQKCDSCDISLCICSVLLYSLYVFIQINNTCNKNISIMNIFSEFVVETRSMDTKPIVQFKVDHPFFFAMLNNDDIIFTGRYIEV